MAPQTAKKPVKAKAKAKAKTKRPVKAKAKKPTATKKKKATTGQSGPPVDVPFEKLNDKEREVLSFLNGKGKGPRNPLKISDIAGSCWKSKRLSKAQGNSWTRNSLRRLICGGWVEKLERGVYRVTEKGRKRLQRA